MDEPVDFTRLTARASVALLAGAPNLLTRSTDRSTLALSGEALMHLNRLVVGPEADAPGLLGEWVDIARRRELPALIYFCPDVAAILAPQAERLDLEPAGQMPLMVFGPEKTPGAGGDRPVGDCTVTEARDAATLHETAAFIGRAVGVPADPVIRTLDPAVLKAAGVSVFVGSRNGVPMSTVTVVQDGDTVSVWRMVTPPEFQRKGVGRALLAQVMGEYRRRGAARFFLFASDMGRPMYASMGFETIAQWTTWVLPAA